MVALNYAKVVLQEEGNTEFPTVMKLTKLFENGHAWDTQLGSLIGNTWCGKFRILLQLRFYVKN